MFIFWTDPPLDLQQDPSLLLFHDTFLGPFCLFLVRDEELVSIRSLLGSLHNNRLLLRKKEGGRRRGEEAAANCFYRAEFRQLPAGGGTRRDEPL